MIRPVGSLDPDVLAAFEWAASRREDSIVRGLSDMSVTLGAGSCGVNSTGTDEVVDDLIVEVSMSSETYPSAAWRPVTSGPDNLPRYGFVEVNPELLPGLRTLEVVDEVALHELGHVLGFGTVGQWYGLVAGGNTVDPRFTGPRALAEYSALGRSGGIPVMTIDGVMQPHWESAFFEEIMASVLDGSPLANDDRFDGGPRVRGRPRRRRPLHAVVARRYVHHILRNRGPLLVKSWASRTPRKVRV